MTLHTHFSVTATLHYTWCRNALEWFSTHSVVHRSWLIKWCLELICYTHSDTIFWTPAWLLVHAFLQSIFGDNNNWGTVAPSSLDLLYPYNFYLWDISKDETNRYDTCSEGSLQKSIAFSFINRLLTCNKHICYMQCVCKLKKPFPEPSLNTVTAQH